MIEFNNEKVRLTRDKMFYSDKGSKLLKAGKIVKCTAVGMVIHLEYLNGYYVASAGTDDVELVN